MNSQDQTVKESLKEVRKSFRVLHEYNQFVTDLIDYLADNIPDIEFYQWSPTYVDTPPNRGSSPLNRNPWRFLPLYDFGVLFLANREYPDARYDDVMFEVNISTESAFLEMDNNKDLPKKGPEEESVTTIGIYLWLNKDENDPNWLNDIWYPCPYYPEDMDTYEDHPNHEVITTGVWENLEHVADRAGADRLLNRFHEAVQQNLGDVLTE